ncbi:MAG: hypothetical protein ABFD89_22700 [Bryobacteraceae bacterium]
MAGLESSLKFQRSNKPMGKYASNTGVSVERSQEEVKKVLRRYGADAFGVYERAGLGSVQFEISGLTIQITVPLPDPKAKQFTATPTTGRKRSSSAAWAAYEQEVKQRWRALLLAIKAKLEAVECHISTIDKEFMPYVVMPDGKCLADHLLPQLHKAVSEGRMPGQLALPLLGK